MSLANRLFGRPCKPDEEHLAGERLDSTCVTDPALRQKVEDEEQPHSTRGPRVEGEA